MDESESTSVGQDTGLAPSRGPGGRRSEGGLFKHYKPEQGKGTRMGTMAGGGALIAWGAYFIFDRLQVYQGDSVASLMVTTGIPVLFAVVFGGLLWWVSFSYRKSSDFMIATEGEMKKVNWSTRREIIGSTKVVILFTALMAVYLFAVDVVFQNLFQWFGVLKR